MTKYVPLSANIFHAEGDLASRTFVALEIAEACTKKWMAEQRPDIDASEAIKRFVEIKNTLKTLAPISFDCRAELTEALTGDDTFVPKEAQDAEGPLFVLGGGQLAGVYRTEDKAREAQAKVPGSYIAVCVTDDPNPRR